MSRVRAPQGPPNIYPHPMNNHLNIPSLDQERIDLFIATAKKMGLKPKQVSDAGLLSIQVDGKERYVFHKSSNPNWVMPSWLSENKYMARVIFERNGLPNIPFCLPTNTSVAQSFLSDHGKIIAKPIKGKKAQDIKLISSSFELDDINLEGRILEKFIEGQETRILVVAGQVIAVHLRVYDALIMDDPDIVKRVSVHKTEWDKTLIQQAIKAAEVIGLQFCVVDFLVTERNEQFILEINSAPGIDKFEVPDEGPPTEMMKIYIEQLVKNYSL